MRPSDEILEGLNRLNKAKETGVYGDKELSGLIIKIVDLAANAMKLGKINLDEAETIKEFIPRNNIFKTKHKDLQVAYDTADQTFSFASVAVDQKNTTVGRQKELHKIA